MKRLFAIFPLFLTACSSEPSTGLNSQITDAIADKDAIGKMRLTQQKMKQDQAQREAFERTQYHRLTSPHSPPKPNHF
ncbi:hypothetical protein E4T80_03775 [Muribacter muris]|uniref:Lipoprotein n=1 Tax=Muribacter muris TaxID=67855 RepID=A0A4Y9K2W0_9PAST|nr:hypothetical protein [Muribacter muris]MBF0784597.1 hypothetical protein [Muribacter muris]MBF0828203.1 hypothetical protein [Muribacter muris]TFV11872.1 hypothetical protein E4T80_03775 [Muribacter muris]